MCLLTSSTRRTDCPDLVATTAPDTCLLTHSANLRRGRTVAPTDCRGRPRTTYRLPVGMRRWTAEDVATTDYRTVHEVRRVHEVRLPRPVRRWTARIRHEVRLPAGYETPDCPVAHALPGPCPRREPPTARPPRGPDCPALVLRANLLPTQSRLSPPLSLPSARTVAVAGPRPVSPRYV